MDSRSNDENHGSNRRESTLARRSVLRAAGAGAVALTAAVGVSTGVRVPESADGDGARTAANDSEHGEAPEFHCSFVELNDLVSESVRVTFTDGSYVATGDGVPNTLGSPGRVVDEVTLGGTTYVNPDPDCDPGEKATTFTCRCVTVEREEFARFFGDAPPADLSGVELLFADGTTERLDSSTDSTGTFRGTGENEDKLLAGLHLWHDAFSTSHVWRNPLVDGASEPSAD